MKKAILILIILCTVSAVAQLKIPTLSPEIQTYKRVDDLDLRLYIYKPEDFVGNKTFSCMVFFHGGGWNNGSYKAFQRQSSYLASRGMVAISVEYRVKNKHNTTPFDAVEDAKSAIRYVRLHAKELHINPNMIASGGGSAGGHLAAACGNIIGLENKNEDVSISSVPDALVLFNPVYDNSKKGYGFNRMEGRYLEISPLHNISIGAPPTIVFFGTDDFTTPVSSSEVYKDKMESVGSRCDLFLYKDAKHSFFNKSPYFEETLEEMDRFLVSLSYLEDKN